MSSSAMDVGKKLVEMCRQGKFKEAVTTHYGPKVVSVEPMSMGAVPARLEGLEAVLGKSDWWEKNHTVHSAQVEGPWPHGDRFIARFKLDVTPKVGPMAGKRITLDEVGLYTVKDGKVVHEEFFYSGG